MCGIIAAFGKKPVDRVRGQFKKQSSRGSDGYGFIALRKGRIVRFARKETYGGISRELNKLRDVDTVLFHHRFPTSTANVAESNHPIPLAHPNWKHRYYILHNGVMTNADSKYSEIHKTGYRFSSEVREVSLIETANGKIHKRYGTAEVNDSEVLGYYIAEMLENKRNDIPLYGAAACIVVQEDEKGFCKVFALRNEGNPLKRSSGRGYLMLSSEEGVNLTEKVLWQVQGLDLADLSPVHCGLSYLYPATIGYSTLGNDDEYDYRPGTMTVSDKLEAELTLAEADLETWEDLLINATGVEKEAVRAEVKRASELVEKLEDALASCSYGTESLAAGLSD